MSEWRDIESAPKDGTHVDIWINGFRKTDAKWDESQNRWKWFECFVGPDKRTKRYSFSSRAEVTHWMPIPAPPKDSGAAHD